MGDKANIQTHSAHANLLCARKTLPKIHPGEILLEEFLNPSGISQHRVPAPTMFLRAASLKSCMANMPSRRVQHYSTFPVEENNRTLQRQPPARTQGSKLSGCLSQFSSFRTLRYNQNRTFYLTDIFVIF